ncbi:MAG: hypothetical protein WCD79_06825 [Chthoniobacteraceae bacterium]
MSYITLNKKEIALLKSAVRRGDQNPDFQNFLVTLDHQLKEWTGQIHVSENMREMIQYYANYQGKPSWRGILHSVFGRTMGENFGKTADPSTNLIITHATVREVEEDHKNRRVV